MDGPLSVIYVRKLLFSSIVIVTVRFEMSISVYKKALELCDLKANKILCDQYCILLLFHFFVSPSCSLSPSLASSE